MDIYRFARQTLRFSFPQEAGGGKWISQNRVWHGKNDVLMLPQEAGGAECGLHESFGYVKRSVFFEIHGKFTAVIRDPRSAPIYTYTYMVPPGKPPPESSLKQKSVPFPRLSSLCRAQSSSPPLLLPVQSPGRNSFNIQARNHVQNPVSEF